MARQFVEPEIGFHAFERLLGTFLGIGPLELLEIVELVLPGVAHAYIEQLGLVAALRYGEGHPLHLQIG